MDLEQTLLILFQRTLESNKDDHLQTILSSQAKIIQQKKENVNPLQQSTSAIQKKLQAIEKNFINQVAFKKRRKSKYDHRSNTSSQIENEEIQTIIYDEDNQEIFNNETNLQKLKRDNSKLQKQITQLQYEQREKYLKNCNEIEQINREKNLVLENTKKLNDKQRKLNQQSQLLQQKQQNLLKQEQNYYKQQQNTDECQDEQYRYDNQLNNRRDEMEKLQMKLNTFVSQLLSLQRNKNKVQCQLNVQIDAVEQLAQFILKERSNIQQDQQYLRQFKEKVLEEKKQLLQLQEQP
ncbi:unnamed protein product [Paramecium pentaurelia]|uniref:Uncharacterized protein n=1 Tax=Paramecium pentaurelia TaxID=43138 RepID=A0A8S1Y548_9CILI|nr:unnamed protein product [Paramecium pentaurelia]